MINRIKHIVIKLAERYGWFTTHYEQTETYNVVRSICRRFAPQCEAIVQHQCMMLYKNGATHGDIIDRASDLMTLIMFARYKQKQRQAEAAKQPKSALQSNAGYRPIHCNSKRRHHSQQHRGTLPR